MKTQLIMLAGETAGPDTTKLQSWVEGNVLPLLLLVLVIGGLIASMGGKTAKLIAIVGCVVICGVILSGGALDFGESLGDLVS